MTVENLSTEDLKNYRLYKDVRQDPLFQKFMQICRNDKDRFYAGWQYEEENSEQTFFRCAGVLVPQLIMLMFFAVQNIFNVIPDFTVVIAAVVCYLICLFICLLNVGLNVTGGVDFALNGVNAAFIVLTGVYMIFGSATVYQVAFGSLLIQLCVRMIFYLFKSIKTQKNYKARKAEIEPYVKKYKENQKLYDDAVAEMYERIHMCNAELKKRGVAINNENTEFWWSDNEQKRGLCFCAGDFFKGNHAARFKSEQCFDEYDIHGNVIGKTEHSYSVAIKKNYYTFPVPQEGNRIIIKTLLDEGYQTLYPFDMSPQEIDNCHIWGICSKWTKKELSYHEKTITKPSQEQIEQERSRINAEVDATERVRNAILYGTDMTVDERFYVTGGIGVSRDEIWLSSNERNHALGKYIESYSDVNVNRDKNEIQEQAIFMFLVNDNIFYIVKEPFGNMGSSYEIVSEKSWIHSRPSEIEAAIETLLKADKKYALDVISHIWCMPADPEKNKLVSSIMHTVADYEDYDKYFVV